MAQIYGIIFSPEAVNDLESIKSYISNTLGQEERACRIVGKIFHIINTLSCMPERHRLVDWEPWFSDNIRQLSVAQYVVFYKVDRSASLVKVIRIIYGGRDIEHLIGSSTDI